MFRLLILLLSLTLLPFAAFAEAPVAFAEEDLTGVYTWPEGSSEEEATYIYRYSYPQIAGDDHLAQTINNVFQYEVSDAIGFECPMTGSDHPAELGQMLVTIGYEITHLSDQCLSVRINKTVTTGDNTTQIIKAFTFALTGPDAGTVTSLPYLLGVLKQGETDEWLIERQTAKVDSCAREMVWALIEQDMKQPGSPIYGDLTLEEFEWGFYPEEDFYLDEEGNFVFFVQEGIIAPFDAGQFFYTITLEELQDEI